MWRFRVISSGVEISSRAGAEIIGKVPGADRMIAIMSVIVH